MQLQSEAESSEPNSATEISTDSEFDHDPRSSVDRHGGKYRAHKVNVRPAAAILQQPSTGTSTRNRAYNQKLTEKEQNRLNRNNYELGLELNIQPLVQVDPSVLNSSRSPLKNPRPGDYLLNKVASTEGMASKKSLELKARYLLGEPANTGIMKSDSTSVLDSKFKSFRSTITECQKLLTASSPKGGEKDAEADDDDDDKGGIYGQINVLKKPDESQILETINMKLVEDKFKGSLSASLSSASKTATNGSSTPIAIDLTEEILRSNEDYIKKLDSEIKDSKVIETIDLTADSPDEYAEKTITRDVIKQEAKELNGKSSFLSRPHSLETNGEQPRSQNYEVAPAMTKKWEEPKKEQKVNAVDSDSLSDASDATSSSSSPSSVHDIPHLILDSTSPDTQNVQTPVNVAPQTLAKDFKMMPGELMQIDSLMIVDGKYVGDVEDLKLLEKLPEGTIVEDKLKRTTTATVVKTEPEPVIRKSIVSTQTTTTTTPAKANLDNVNKNRPALKFDTKNENKVDTLKNIPMSVRPLNRMVEASKKKSEDHGSDSESHAFTETELSDWAADDVVSENFVDLEFALNSNKGTIKRNKKAKKKDVTAGSPKREGAATQSARDKDVAAVPEKRQETCSIMKNLGVENIEFMDTGSDESCAETYSTTNKAMLKNRGYVKFVETNHHQQHHHHQSSPLYRNTSSVSMAQNKQSNYEAMAIKEDPQKEIPGIDFVEQGACILSSDYNELKTPVNEVPRMEFSGMSLKFSGIRNSTDSLHDIEQDSLLIVDNVKEVPARRDSDRTPQNAQPKAVLGDGLHEKERRRSQERLVDEAADAGATKDDDMTYEEYVKQLQNKITQISNARDSLEMKKARRKSSKGDLTANGGGGGGGGAAVVVDYVSDHSTNSARPLSIFDQGIVTQPPTLTKKLEEITKERAKQKDLIHDLVMDKLQTKKQLNAEKRLNRSRNRQIGALSPGLPMSPISKYSPIPPPLPPKSGTSDEDGVKRLDPGQEIGRRSLSSTNGGSPAPLKENGLNKENLPLNDNLANSSSSKISKTQSFCVYPSRTKASLPGATTANYHVDNNFMFATPVRNSGQDPGTDKLRTEARARALLKTNEELGLSPEEKILQLRRKYHLEKHSQQQQQTTFLEMLGTNKSDDVKAKEKSLMTSKSVNDIRNEKASNGGGEGKAAATEAVNGDQLQRKRSGEFHSDPNLLESKGTASESVGPAVEGTKRRGGKHKDPERRKSLIQAVSDFFHKRKEAANSNSTCSSAVHTPNGGGGGSAAPKDTKMDTLLNRFKISPKSKDKTKVSDTEISEVFFFSGSFWEDLDGIGDGGSARLPPS